MQAKTIFVGSLPASASNERLEEIFSEVGPVKQCFVVREKGTEKCRGFGYVTYSMEDDAQRALKEIKEYDGHRLALSVAKKKIKDRKKTAPKEPAAAPKENEQKSKGFCKKILKARLIIRNLSFKCSEHDLKQVCAKFGTVLEAKIPLKPDGKMRGFAFVLFKNVSQAARALSGLNLKEIKGRQVAVDWAVPKDKYMASQPSSNAENKTTAASTAKHSDTDSDEEEEDEEKKQAAPKKKKAASKPAVQQVDESQSDEEDNSEEEDSEIEEEEDEEDNDDDVSQEGDDDDDDDGDDNDKSSNEDSDESENEDDEEEDTAQKKASRKLLPSDVQEGRTVFIRNLSFETDDEGLEEVLLEYGELNYVKVVIHPDTEHSKGCAFAKFKTKEAADRCLAAAQDESENGGIRVHGRKLFIVAAVTREDAAKLKENKKKVESGTRNLYLAREGLVRAGTKAAEDVPEADMIKRARFEEIKRAKLRDIHVFVSKTRLCVHNLPKFVDRKKLKEFCLQAVRGSKGVVITECRVMYDKKPEKGQVMGQSLGYGFVEFRCHEHALSTLRYLNNNPNIFGPNKRPIVEFSLEDSRKLKLKEKRKEKYKEFIRNQPFKRGTKHQSHTAGGEGPSRGGNKAKTSSDQAGKNKAPPQHQKRQGYFSGFQTNPEVEHVDLENGKKRRKVLAFPSHRGPKIRMRDKGKQRAPPPKPTKPKSNRKERKRHQMEKPTQPRNQNAKTAKKHFKNRDGDRFDSLVEQYKKKLTGSGDKNTNMKRNKWFNI